MRPLLGLGHSQNRRSRAAVIHLHLGCFAYALQTHLRIERHAAQGQQARDKVADLFTAAAQDQLRRLRSGARILLNHEVTGIQSRGNDIYQVETSQGPYRAAILVIAAGAWCGDIGAMLGLRIPIVPVRGQMWASAPLPPGVFHTISAAESVLQWHTAPGNDDETPPCLTHRGEQRLTRHLYGRQTRAGEIIFGGDRQLVGYHKIPDPAGIEVNHRHAAEVLPFLRELPVQRTWAGLMPFPLDGAPIIGKISQRPSLYIVSGLASSGFGRGPMAGKSVYDIFSEGDTMRIKPMRL
jgi:glycine/D-amino acid oxidase-like deaminating enzyme